MTLAATPEPPYTAVIFTSSPSGNHQGYDAMAERMARMVCEQPGYLGHESARTDEVGITVSYWRSEDDAAAWKRVAEHVIAQRRGQLVWYDDYRVRVATVKRDYGG